jgi:hypothetical protein
MFFYKLLNFFYNDRILGQASRKIGESVGSISRGPTPDFNGGLFQTAELEFLKSLWGLGTEEE